MMNIYIRLSKKKNKRAAGDDNISVELMKYGGEAVENMMLQIIQARWKSERMTVS